MSRGISLLTNTRPPIFCFIFVLSQCSCHHLALFGAEKAMVVVCFALTGAPLCPPPPANPPSATTLPSLLKLSFGVTNRSSQSPLTLKSTTSRTISSLIHRPRATPSSALPYPTGEGVREGNDISEERRDAFDQWNSWTGKFAGAANVPFLLLQLPQIILNAQNLLAGNKSALFAVPWLGMLTGLLGNLSLLSYFAKKKETEAVLVQTLGVVSTYVVIAQLALADAMPLPHFMAITIVVVSGLVINCLNYFSLLNSAIWRFWEDFTTIGGLSVLSQVMWSTFVPFLPNSIVPGICALIVAVVAVSLARTENLSEEGVTFVGSLSGWTATLLFMWMPVAQMWTNYLNPDNIRGLSAYTMLLAMIGNGLLIPRALFIRDLMWFTGSSWGSFLQGWGNLICMYCFNSISREFFSAATLGFIAWLGLTLWKDTKAYGYSSPLRSLKELVFGP